MTDGEQGCCAHLKIRSYSSLESHPGYSLSVIEGKVSSVEGIIVVPAYLYLLEYFTEMIDIQKIFFNYAKKNVGVLTQAYEEIQKTRVSQPSCKFDRLLSSDFLSDENGLRRWKVELRDS